MAELTPYHELVYHLDLCMLSYHLHAQTLIWPLDPYMEQVAVKLANRRENFVTHTHRYFTGQRKYHGPGSTQNWPSSVLLDPIMSNYDQLHPWRPVFLGAERGAYVWHNTPKAIIDPISEVFVQTYDQADRDARPLAPPKALPGRPDSVVNDGKDLLYCFEGGTGTIDGSPASWSIMGFCLVRINIDKTYDVHVAFRGSRSGSATRAIGGGLQSDSRAVFAVRTRDETGERQYRFPGTAKHLPRGNGDWITDMDFNEDIQDPDISVYGSVCRGFSASVKTSLPLIVNCMDAIHIKMGKAPRLIWATGHSLGGALAGEFTSAMVCGTKYGPYGSKLSDNLKTWPWKDFRLISMSAPVVGGDRFHSAFNSRVYARRVVLASDPITQALRHYHVGAQIELKTTDGVKDPGDANKKGSGFAFHEPFNVRRSLIEHLELWGGHDGKVPLHFTDENHQEPMKYYKTFDKMLEDQMKGGPEHLYAVVKSLTNHPEEFRHYLEILRLAMEDQSTYKAGSGSLLPWKSRISDEDKRQINEKFITAIGLLTGHTTGTLQEWNDCMLNVGGESFSKFLRLGMILAACAKDEHPKGARSLRPALEKYGLKDA